MKLKLHFPNARRRQRVKPFQEQINEAVYTVTHQKRRLPVDFSSSEKQAEEPNPYRDNANYNTALVDVYPQQPVINRQQGTTPTAASCLLDGIHADMHRPTNDGK